MSNIKLLYVDLFCGAGGTSTGVESSRLHGEKCAKVIACVNHDAAAIASHAANHPDVLHFTEDIRTLDLSSLAIHVGRMKSAYPKAHIVLWASLECTNFSKAKGGQPRDADSRTLADHLFRYIDILRPDYIQIENVEEFMCWGDLDAKGHPVSKDKGRCYIRWTQSIRQRGYDFDWRILNSADFGAYTSRKRYFGQFAKIGLPIAFPAQTHSKNGDGEPVRCGRWEAAPMFHLYEKWRSVKDVLDLRDEGNSIFGRSKPLCEKTLERIYAGLVKFVAGGKQRHEAWILKYNSMNKDTHAHTPPSLDDPCPTVATQNRLGVVKVHFLSKHFSGAPESKNIGVDGPAGAITTKDHHSFISVYYGNGFNRSIEEPSPTVTTKDRIEFVTSQFLDMQYGNGTPSSIDVPSPAVVNNPKQNLVTCKKAYLMNPYSFKSDGGSIEKPCFTLIARMDKMPPYLVTTETGELQIAIYEDDTPMMCKIKEFMAMYYIVDIKMRMLNISELKRIMGFPEDYKLIGTKAEQKKFIGNAVEVNMSRALCEALCEKLEVQTKKLAI